MSKSKRQKRKAIKSPRRLRMKREGRLQSARATNWVGKFQGKHIVRAYRKWFGIDLLCAIAELRMLGVEVSSEYENQVRRSVEQQSRVKKQKSEIAEAPFEDVDCDEIFAYIAGTTSGGVPYGVTWEEWDADDFVDDPNNYKSTSLAASATGGVGGRPN